MIDKSDYDTDGIDAELVDKLFDLINTRNHLHSIVDSIEDEEISNLFSDIETGWFEFEGDEVSAALDALAVIENNKE